MPRRLLFGAATVVLSSARLTPSSDLASASNSATRRIAERANEPSAMTLACLALDVCLTDRFLNGSHPRNYRDGTVEVTPLRVQSAAACPRPSPSRQTEAARTARV